MMALFFAFLPFTLVFSIYGTQLYNKEGELGVERWFTLVEGFFFFFYRLLMEIADKQAKRTGNRSALDRLFRHICNTFAMVFQTLVLAKCFQVGDNFRGIFGVLAPCATYYISTLEEYYTGGLQMGPCNGVTDGSGIIYFLLLITTIVGNEFWVSPVANAGTVDEMRLIDVAVYILIAF